MAAKVKDGLFIGDEDTSKDPEFLDLNKISNLVNLSGKDVPNTWSSHGLVYLTYNWEDRPEYNLFDKKDDILVDMIEFIDTSLRHGVSVLLFSKRGVGRSAVAVCAYLMCKYRWGFEKTFSYLSIRKIDIDINDGFVYQLCLLDKRIRQQRQQLITSMINTLNIEENKKDIITSIELSRWKDWDTVYIEKEKKLNIRLSPSNSPITNETRLVTILRQSSIDEIILIHSHLNSRLNMINLPGPYIHAMNTPKVFKLKFNMELDIKEFHINQLVESIKKSKHNSIISGNNNSSSGGGHPIRSAMKGGRQTYLKSLNDRRDEFMNSTKSNTSINSGNTSIPRNNSNTYIESNIRSASSSMKDLIKEESDKKKGDDYLSNSTSYSSASAQQLQQQQQQRQASRESRDKVLMHSFTPTNATATSSSSTSYSNMNDNKMPSSSSYTAERNSTPIASSTSTNSSSSGSSGRKTVDSSVSNDMSIVRLSKKDQFKSSSYSQSNTTTTNRNNNSSSSNSQDVYNDDRRKEDINAYTNDTIRSSKGLTLSSTPISLHTATSSSTILSQPAHSPTQHHNVSPFYNHSIYANQPASVTSSSSSVSATFNNNNNNNSGNKSGNSSKSDTNSIGDTSYNISRNNYMNNNTTNNNTTTTNTNRMSQSLPPDERLQKMIESMEVSSKDKANNNLSRINNNNNNNNNNSINNSGNSNMSGGRNNTASNNTNTNNNSNNTSNIRSSLVLLDSDESDISSTGKLSNNNNTTNSYDRNNKNDKNDRNESITDQWVKQSSLSSQFASSYKSKNDFLWTNNESNSTNNTSNNTDNSMSNNANIQKKNDSNKDKSYQNEQKEDNLSVQNNVRSVPKKTSSSFGTSTTMMNTFEQMQQNGIIRGRYDVQEDLNTSSILRSSQQQQQQQKQQLQSQSQSQIQGKNQSINTKNLINSTNNYSSSSSNSGNSGMKGERRDSNRQQNDDDITAMDIDSEPVDIGATTDASWLNTSISNNRSSNKYTTTPTSTTTKNRYTPPRVTSNNNNNNNNNASNTYMRQSSTDTLNDSNLSSGKLQGSVPKVYRYGSPAMTRPSSSSSSTNNTDRNTSFLNDKRPTSSGNMNATNNSNNSGTLRASNSSSTRSMLENSNNMLYSLPLQEIKNKTSAENSKSSYASPAPSPRTSSSGRPSTPITTTTTTGPARPSSPSIRGSYNSNTSIGMSTSTNAPLRVYASDTYTSNDLNQYNNSSNSSSSSSNRNRQNSLQSLTSNDNNSLRDERRSGSTDRTRVIGSSSSTSYINNNSGIRSGNSNSRPSTPTRAWRF